MVETDEITDGVQDTLFIPLLMRRRDLREKDPILGDQAAGEIFESIDYDWSRYDRSGTSLSYIGCLVRARYIDEEVERLAGSLSTPPLIVNAGCGLDTRHHRLVGRVPAESALVDLDFPEVIAVREQVLPPLGAGDRQACQVSGSLLDESTLREVKALAPSTDAPIIVALEGVLMYFTRAQVVHFLRLLSEVLGPEVYLIADYTHPMMIGQGKHHDELRKSRADFMSGFTDSEELASLIPGTEALREETTIHLMRPYSFVARIGYLIPKVRRGFQIATLRLH